MIKFFEQSELLDYEVLRPLSHIRSNWELISGVEQLFEPENDSFAEDLNKLINELDMTAIPKRYHDNEDQLAKYVKDKFDSEIKKVGDRWIGKDYCIILQDGGLFDIDESNLIQSAKGRIIAARKFGQSRYDDMESGHRKMLALILTLILYHRADT